MPSQQHTEALIEMNGKLERMMDGIDIVKEKQMEMADDVAKIKEAVYNPDEGIYARIRELETFKRHTSTFMWMVLTALIGLGLHQAVVVL